MYNGQNIRPPVAQDKIYHDPNGREFQEYFRDRHSSDSENEGEENVGVTPVPVKQADEKK